jgi:putative nucleotidyltransferase with HDIG domain
MSNNDTTSIGSLSKRSLDLLLVAMTLGVTLTLHHLILPKQPVLHFYYLPVIIAAYNFGRRAAVTMAGLSFLFVSVFAWAEPSAYAGLIRSPIVPGFGLLVWGAFLTLNAFVLGILCDQSRAQIKELREAHVGIMEILAKYLQAADQYTKSHSMRVADLAEEIATNLNLQQAAIEDIRVGALLHDIGKVEVSTRLIQKAAGLTQSERNEMATHTFRGVDLVRSLGTILEDALPVILHHHDHYSAESKAEGLHGDAIPLGARVVAVADAYDAIITDRPYRKGRTPEEAVAAIQECAGKQFDPQVVAAFERVMLSRTEEELHTAPSPAGAGIKPEAAARNVEIPLPRTEQPANEPLHQPDSVQG